MRKIHIYVNNIQNIDFFHENCVLLLFRVPSLLFRRCLDYYFVSKGWENSSASVLMQRVRRRRSAKVQGESIFHGVLGTRIFE